MEEHPGRFQTIVYLPPSADHPRGSSFRTDRNLWVEPTEELMGQLADLAGKENVKTG